MRIWKILGLIGFILFGIIGFILMRIINYTFSRPFIDGVASAEFVFPGVNPIIWKTSFIFVGIIGAIIGIVIGLIIEKVKK